MAGQSPKISRRFVIILILVLVGLYGLAWAIYGLDYMWVHKSVIRHYGHSVKVQECLGGPVSRLVDESQFGINVAGVNGLTPITPILLYKGFTYNIDYNKNSQIWQAYGSISAFGHLHEEYNSQMPPCLSQ